MFVWYNPNPSGKNVGDCPVRAICRATGQGWHETYVQLCMQGLALADMPSANTVWGAYLKNISAGAGVPCGVRDRRRLARHMGFRSRNTLVLLGKDG